GFCSRSTRTESRTRSYLSGAHSGTSEPPGGISLQVQGVVSSRRGSRKTSGTRSPPAVTSLRRARRVGLRRVARLPSPWSRRRQPLAVHRLRVGKAHFL